MRRRRLLYCGAGALLGVVCNVGSARAQTELVVVVNAAADGKPLNEAQLAAIFTGANKKWDNGMPIKVFNLAPQSPGRVLFDAAVLKRTPEQVSQYWIDKLVRGEGLPPTQVPRVDAMAKVVATLRGAIGYVTADKLDAKLRAVARIRGGKVVAP